MSKMFEDSSVPLYQQIADDLRKAIGNDAYHVGGKIPTEPELSKLYGVSRITVRKAVEVLVEQGFLVKCQGKGTFVRKAQPALMVCDDRSVEVSGFTSSCKANGLTPGAHVLRCERLPVPEDEFEFFGDDGVEGLLAIDRIRTADGEPIMIEANLFPYKGLEFLASANLEDASLFALIEEGTGRRAQRNSAQTLNITLADERLSRILRVPVGEPLFYLVGRYRDQGGRPLYYGRQHIIGSRYTFAM